VHQVGFYYTDGLSSRANNTKWGSSRTERQILRYTSIWN